MIFEDIVAQLMFFRREGFQKIFQTVLEAMSDYVGKISGDSKFCL